MSKKRIVLAVIGGIILAIIIVQSIAHAYTEGTTPIVYKNKQEIELKPALVRSETEEERLTRKILNAFPNAPIMVKVAWCESRLDPHAVGWSDGRDHGLFQIRDIHDTRGLDMFDEDDNISFAKQLYQESGLRPWRASEECWLDS